MMESQNTGRPAQMMTFQEGPHALNIGGFSYLALL